MIEEKKVKGLVESRIEGSEIFLVEITIGTEMISVSWWIPWKESGLRNVLSFHGG